MIIVLSLQIYVHKLFVYDIPNKKAQNTTYMVFWDELRKKFLFRDMLPLCFHLRIISAA